MILVSRLHVMPDVNGVGTRSRGSGYMVDKQTITAWVVFGKRAIGTLLQHFIGGDEGGYGDPLP